VRQLLEPVGDLVIGAPTLPGTGIRSVREQARKARLIWWLSYLVVIGFGLVVGGLAWLSAPRFLSVAFAALTVTLVAWLIRPVLGLHLTTFFALVGDTVTVKWFPFNKNFSSRESIFYVADQITLSPLDLVLGFALVTVVLRRLADPTRRLVTGPMFKPFLLFAGICAFSFLMGVGRGGDLRVAIFEVRPLFYLPIMYLIVINICDTPERYRRLLYTAMAAVFVQTLLSIQYYTTLSTTEKDELEALTEHGSTIAMNALFVLAISALLLKRCSGLMRLGLVVLAAPVVWVYFISQRRAAFVSLATAVLLLLVVLFWRQRGTFWRFAPILIIGTVGYVGAFWNNTGSVGFPAQAVKSVIAPGSLSAEDQSSDLYRVVENFNLHFTIHSNPVLGLGFGQRFYQPVRLPDISFFEFYEFMPHNSILWIWINTGFAGFVTMFYLLGRSVMIGARRLRIVPDGRDAAALTTAVLFIVMYAVYAYVDIAWDARNMVLLGAMIAMATHIIRPVAATADTEP
jgi:hypothetical protein